MNSYRRIRSAIFSHPWAILPSRLETIFAYLAARADGVELNAGEIAEFEAAKRSREMKISKNVAVIPITGTIAHRMGGMDAMSGGASTKQISADTRRALDDNSVAGVVYHIHSPGGTVDGVPELADEIRSLRGSKPIYAVADTMAASAAYWIASAADEVFVTPSGQVGSIGVFAVHEDFSEQYEQLGERRELIASSKFKGEGMDFMPLTSELRAHIEEQVLAYDDLFVSAVAKGRGVAEGLVRNKFGQGRMVMAKDAVRVGMADNVGTLDAAIDQILQIDVGGSGRRVAESRRLVMKSGVPIKLVRPLDAEVVEPADEATEEPLQSFGEFVSAAEEDAGSGSDPRLTLNEASTEPTDAESTPEQPSNWRAALNRRRLQLHGRGPGRGTAVQ